MFTSSSSCQDENSPWPPISGQNDHPHSQPEASCYKFTLCLFTAHPAGLSCVGKRCLVGQVGGFPPGAFTPTWLKLPPDTLIFFFWGGGGVGEVWGILSILQIACAFSSSCFHQEEMGTQSHFLGTELGSNYGHDWIYFNHVHNTNSVFLPSLSRFLNCPLNTPASTFPIFIA